MKRVLISKGCRICSPRRFSTGLKRKSLKNKVWANHIVKHTKKEFDQTDKLSIEDVESFFNSIENPPEPNEKVKAAMKLYQESVIDV